MWQGSVIHFWTVTSLFCSMSRAANWCLLKKLLRIQAFSAYSYFKTFVEKLEKHLWRGIFYESCEITDKKPINFFELALVSVHCYCPIRCIMIAWGYRSWNNANITADIYLLIKDGNKNNETKCKVCSNFFYQSFGCHKSFNTLFQWYYSNFKQVNVSWEVFR